jgi:hypothetical protein
MPVNKMLDHANKNRFPQVHIVPFLKVNLILKAH